ncbi:MAG: hypothetical protein ABIG93_00165 [archaeon]|nr:hypothetical protein [Nanoarchaeota archaeon]
MGLFFGKKKNESKVPVPMRNVSEEKVLSFSKKPESERIIHPEELKAAAGLGQESRTMKDFEHPLNSAPGPIRAASRPTMSEMANDFAPMIMAMPAPGVAPAPTATGPVHLHVKTYQRILGELDGMKNEINELSNINKSLEKSEYNEDKDFAKLKITIKCIHDKLLSADKILFRS